MSDKAANKHPPERASAPKAKRGRPADPDARVRILKGAAAAFMARGFSGTSLDDVAQAIGATKGFIYPHFVSKADLYFAIQETATEHITSVVGEEFTRQASPVEKLRSMAFVHVMSILQDFPSAKVGVQGLERGLMHASGDQERRRLKRYIRMRDAHEAMFREVITAGIEQGQFRSGPVGLLAKGVLGALNWTTLWFDPDRPTSTEKMNEIARTLADYAVEGLKR